MAAAQPGSPDPHLASLESWQGAPRVTADEPPATRAKRGCQQRVLGSKPWCQSLCQRNWLLHNVCAWLSRRGAVTRWKYQGKHLGSVAGDVASENTNSRQLCNLALF